MNDNADMIGWMIVGTFHLCAACLHKFAAKLDSLPPFLEQMRFELNAAAVYPPPKARYRDILAMYREHFPERLKNVDEAALEANAPVPPSIPEIRKMLKPDLMEATLEFYPELNGKTQMSRDELVEALIAHLESKAKTVEKAPAKARA